MKVGYTGNNYPEKRNIIQRVPQVEYKNVSRNNFYAYLNRINFWFTQKGFSPPIDTDYYQFKNIMPLNVDGMHFFNSVSYGSDPWITTFETVLPYFNKMKSGFKQEGGLQMLTVDPFIHRAMDTMRQPNCKALLALSQSTMEIQKRVLQCFPEYEKIISSKIQVLHPPQKANAYIPRKWDGVWRILFVGRAFYRKGGQEMVHALEEIRKEFPLHLTIVSSMDVESGWPGIDHRQREKDIQWLSEQDWITWHVQLPNEQVLTLMQESHLGLLPTWQDTYGYSVLEMQANGCPVLTTSIRSLPEINRDEVGWRVQHATNIWGEWSEIPTARESFISQELIHSLKEQLRRIFSNPEEMESKGRNAVDRIMREHNPDIHANRLNEIYQEMFNKK
jgi:glycosyltransferase involved in cell wall biosynthesis